MVFIKARKANVICTNHEIDPPRFQPAQTFFFFALDKRAVDPAFGNSENSTIDDSAA